jgi:hypothetical protein
MTTVLAAVRRGHPGLFALAVVMTALVPVVATLAMVDQRVLLGAPLWFKPLKFTVSVAAYTATLSWMLGQLRERVPQRAGWVLTGALAVEMAIIYGQAALGNRSHFNDDGGVGTLLFGVMGASIVVLWLATFAVALRFLREPGRDRAAGTAVRLGLAVTLLGLLEGFAMIAISGHAVGVPDGGPGLPLLGWSTSGGDLRIAHFVGMHALQGLPLLAAALGAAPRLDETARVRTVRVAAAAWAGLVVLLTWQALRAEPLLAPDGTTLAALAALALGAAAGLARVLAAPRRAATPAH